MSTPRFKHMPGDPALAARFGRELEGEVLFDAFTRGRYSTDASIYQAEPVGVIVPRSEQDIVRTIQIAAEEGVPVLARGGGTSQCGQTVGNGIVADVSKYLNKVLSLDTEARTVRVQPGIVLEQLNNLLKPHGLFFPIDPSTASRATIGGMAGNNSCGARSIRYGNMVHNVCAIDAVMANGQTWHFGPVAADLDGLRDDPGYRKLVERLRAIASREAAEIEARMPKLLRRIGGYNIDSIAPGGHNMARMLVGSEGTLAFFTAIELELQTIPAHKVLGVCQFSTFYQAMDATRHIVTLAPAAVELIDRTRIELARDIAAFRPTVERFVRGKPEALLLVEFAGDDHTEQIRRLAELEQLMGTLGFADALIKITDSAFQRAVWEVRKAGLNIMMSMKGDGKPVSFIEDCAVELDDLAEYTDRLTN
ncbi:MAG: FAD-binding oxidoreductase, partial [Acidiferrobacterales bacterium]